MSRLPNTYALVLESPLGRLGIRLRNEAVCRLDFLPAGAPLKGPQTRVERRIARAIERYFERPDLPFTLPLALTGTPFQQRVWAALQAIPRGETRTYAGLASALGSGARAVGNACRRNPASIVVPCHRVVAASGLGGYGGRTGERATWRKHWLLSHEGASCPGLKTRRAAPTVNTQHVIQRTIRA
jgi:methylated-DNA-[protein]-cysteine S-methyltransferase